MKKNSICLLWLFAILFIFGCSNCYEDYKTVKIPEVGSFKVLGEWGCSIKDDIIFFTKNNTENLSRNEMCLVGAITDGGKGIKQISEFYGDEIKDIELINSEVYSNNVIVSRSKFVVGTHLSEKYTLWLNSGNKSVYFIVLDEKINYETISKIGKSFLLSNS